VRQPLLNKAKGSLDVPTDFTNIKNTRSTSNSDERKNQQTLQSPYRVESEQTTSNNTVKNNTTQYHNSKHSCIFCSHVSRSQNHLINHMNNHLVCPLLECNKYRMTNSGHYYLMMHISIQHKNKISQLHDQYLKFFNGNLPLQDSDLTRSYNALKKVFCPYSVEGRICGKFHSTSALLKKHLIRHEVTGYICRKQNCAYSTHTKDNLAFHVKLIHKMTKPYKCSHPNCVAAYKKEKTLNNHILNKHTLKKAKCRCQSSQRYFVRKSNLTVHQKRNHKHT